MSVQWPWAMDLVSWEVRDPGNPESFLEVGSKQAPPTRDVIDGLSIADE